MKWELKSPFSKVVDTGVTNIYCETNPNAEVAKMLHNAEIDAITAERDKWRNAVIDAAVVNWTYAKEDEENPSLAVSKLLACAAREALDPQISPEAKKLHDRIAELSTEKDELRGKLDDVRMGIGCARGQRTTQYCADLTQRDEVITKLLAMLKPGEEPMRYMLGDQKVDYRPTARLHAHAVAIAEGRNP